jgi:hypothetical protein
MTMPSGAELQLRHCPICSINYPVVANELPDSQACPVCAVNANSPGLSRTDCASDSEDTDLKPA